MANLSIFRKMNFSKKNRRSTVQCWFKRQSVFVMTVRMFRFITITCTIQHACKINNLLINCLLTSLMHNIETLSFANISKNNVGINKSFIEDNTYSSITWMVMAQYFYLDPKIGSSTFWSGFRLKVFWSNISTFSSTIKRHIMYMQRRTFPRFIHETSY